MSEGQKKPRRSKEEIEAEKAAKAAAKAEKEAKKAEAEKAAKGEAGDSADNGESDKSAYAAEKMKVNAPLIGGDGLKSLIRIQNSSQNILVIPISDSERQIITPFTSWAVPQNLLERAKEILRAPYYKNLLDLGHIRVHEVQPTRLGEIDLKSPQTPEPPKELTEKPEHVTKAEFIKNEDEG